MSEHMTLKEFSDQITQVYVQRPDPLTYGILGLGGEAGEVTEKYKKLMRTGWPVPIPPDSPSLEESIMEILLELGDVLWYVTKIAKELGSDLEEVARMNVEKLKAREEDR